MKKHHFFAVLRPKRVKKRCFWGILGLKTGLKAIIFNLKTAFLGVKRVFLGRKVYQLYQVFHMYRGTLRH